MAKGSSLILSILILTLGCGGLTEPSVAEGPGMIKERKVKKLLQSKQVIEIQQMAGSIGVVKVGNVSINNIGTRGEIAIIQVLEHDLVSWNEKESDQIEIRRYTKNANTVLEANKYYFVLLASISGSHEYYWLNEYLEVKETEVHSVMTLTRKEYKQ